MYKSSLQICSQGYNIEQTDYYIASLEERINFAETAYADAVKRIKALEAQNEMLVKEVALKLSLVADKIGVESAEEYAEEVITEAEVIAEESQEEVSDTEIAEESSEADDEVSEQVPDAEITNLKSQIDELKSFFRE